MLYNLAFFFSPGGCGEDAFMLLLLLGEIFGVLDVIELYAAHSSLKTPSAICMQCATIYDFRAFSDFHANLWLLLFGIISKLKLMRKIAKAFTLSIYKPKYCELHGKTVWYLLQFHLILNRFVGKLR